MTAVAVGMSSQQIEKIIDRVLSIALAEVGYLEKETNADLDDKTANAGDNNYTKYGRDMHAVYPSVMDFPAAWCDAFVDWCFYQAYGLANAKSLIGGDFNDYTVASAQLYKNKGAYHKTPKKGDQIFFKNSKRICHTGLVYKVDDKYVYTIEGNTSSGGEVIANGGAVCTKKYLLTNSRIDGYGRPNYSIVSVVTLKDAQETLQKALKIIEGNGETLQDAQNVLKQALKITPTTPTVPQQTPVVQTPQVSVKNEIVAQGQQHSNNFVGDYHKIVVDGDRGSETARQGCRVLQHAMNCDYKSGLKVDGLFQTKSKEALGNHYVRRGETQYMVTAVEILLMLKGYNPNGVECPGQFGGGLEDCVEQYQEDHGFKADGIVTRKVFLSLIA